MKVPLSILHHDFPDRVRRDPEFRMTHPPISEANLAAQGLAAPFIDYIRHWPGFIAVAQEGAPSFPGH